MQTLGIVLLTFGTTIIIASVTIIYGLPYLFLRQYEKGKAERWKSEDSLNDFQ